ncbi:unnamed protein product [Effrenium voratum]|uniref:Helicase C-terminal domain-containing protein n=1 Tax=Effrenium voratum TaxID=2562239 RepID=A0AA36N109_9DINO|nr:unnamed protein product [Effrenium voratum]
MGHFLSFRGHALPLLDSEFHPEAFQRARDLQNEKVKQAPKPNRRVSVTFENRPFGMTPLKEGVEGYVVDKVNHNDPSKPAARLGVKPGWIVSAVAGETVQGLSLDDVQQLTKQAELPVTVDFEVPVKEKENGNSSSSTDKQRPKSSAAPPPPSRESRERTETHRLQALLRALDSDAKLPATVFVFSRRRVEALAGDDMPNLDVCTVEEKSKVHTFLKKSFERLSEVDQMLPQVKKVEELASRGVGIHHGGLLPVVKEAVEIMFSRGLVKVLFATETFAMGVNMPARSVIFTAWAKHDGNQRRPLLPSEYTQMAGRAGRRGLDTEGNVYILCGDEVPDQKKVTRMMTSKAEPLLSRFRVTFAMILQMKRFAQSGVQVEDLLGQSFLENARARRRPKARQDLKERSRQLEALPPLQCVFGEPDMEDYADMEVLSRQLGLQLHARLCESKSRDKVFCPGRLPQEMAVALWRGLDVAVLIFAAMVLESLRFSREKGLEVLDQLQVPHQKEYIRVTDSEVRGAPLLAMVSALGLAVEALERARAKHEGARAWLLERMSYLKTSRPTAVNLFNTMDSLREVVDEAAASGQDDVQIYHAYVDAAERMLEEDVTANKAIGDVGADAILAALKGKARVLTICNTGSLATAGWGTALGVLRTLHARGRRLEQAYCLETRPYNQGARLTAFELVEDGLPGTLICDSMAAALMQRRGVDACVVGADRVVANGDTANKIGTYALAVLARYHGIPFYVAAPLTTLDAKMRHGSEIPIEESGRRMS